MELQDLEITLNYKNTFSRYFIIRTIYLSCFHILIQLKIINEIKPSSSVLNPLTR